MQKKNMNNVQRKMLDKIYTEVMTGKKREYIELRQDGRKLLKEKVLKQANVKAKALLKKVNTVMTDVYKAAAELEKDGLSIAMSTSLKEQGSCSVTQFHPGHKDRKAMVLYTNNYSYREGPTEIKEYDEATANSTQALNDLTMEIRADIYGLEISYDAIRGELDKKIKHLKLA